jgi:hypothetical protein
MAGLVPATHEHRRFQNVPEALAFMDHRHSALRAAAGDDGECIDSTDINAPYEITRPPFTPSV